MAGRRRHPHRGHKVSAAARRRISHALRGRHHKGHKLSAAARRRISRALRGRHHHRLKHRLKRHLKGRKVVRVSRHRGGTGHHHRGRRISVRRLLHLLTRHRLHLVRGLHSRRHRKVRLLRRPRAIPVSKG